MKDKTFIKIFAAILIAGTLLTFAHLIYAAYAWHHSSIIYFISKEDW